MGWDCRAVQSVHPSVCKPHFCVVLGWIALARHWHAAPQACHTLWQAPRGHGPCLPPTLQPILHSTTPALCCHFMAETSRLAVQLAKEPCHWECENQESLGSTKLLGHQKASPFPRQPSSFQQMKFNVIGDVLCSTSAFFTIPY